MAEAYCACIIANVEGLKHIPLPSDVELKLTLEALDTRARRVESRSYITPPPPMLDASWDSLTWRVCRLARLRTGRRILKKAPPLSDIVSLPFLRSLMTTLDGFQPQPLHPLHLQQVQLAQRSFSWPEKDDVEDKEFLGRVAQWLCHIAGLRGFQVENTTFELKSICSLAIDLSLETESGPPFARGPGMVPPMPGARVVPGRVGCCNCCTHGCQGPPGPGRGRAPSVSSVASSRSGRGGCAKWKLFGWVKKLAFWRRKRVTDDDASSLAETLAD
ncbi:hypothetical protein F4820DRAFT_11702 [Hypoxylon rubiginosum]|uniref:Uncharacterized protein n=1 Tax=Hypoxylon rubiginosum TaxID=110542 RepID=A0ACB9ZD48_9PEZI|nr:hypothetical protein F4820DRAFT_11702 [Hypoxylon rubiginosum]